MIWEFNILFPITGLQFVKLEKWNVKPTRLLEAWKGKSLTDVLEHVIS